MSPFPTTHQRASPDALAQPRSYLRRSAGAALPAAAVLPPRLARGWKTAAPPTLTASPHAAPLHP